MTVWLCQVKCERGHCMVGGGFDDAKCSVEQGQQATREGWAQMIASGITPRCRICGSEAFHTHTGRVRWATIEEAMPYLQMIQAANLRSGDLWEAAAELAERLLRGERDD